VTAIEDEKAELLQKASKAEVLMMLVVKLLEMVKKWLTGFRS